MAHGKLNHADVSEAAIENGDVDLIAIGHGLIAEPHWANKVRKGKTDEINPCIGCGECHFNAMKGWARPCAVNPLCLHEKDFEFPPADRDMKILVIGAGPGGMKAAATAAERGFKVILCEKNNYMGGNLYAAGTPRFKRDVLDQVNYLIRQVYKHGVDVRLGQAVTLEDVKKIDPDYVVVASGADPVIIRVPGYDKPQWMCLQVRFRSAAG